MALPDDARRPLRRSAGHGEHGGPFPLPLPEIMPIRSDCVLPQYLQQRLGRMRSFSRECIRAVLTLQLCLQVASPGSISRSSASPLPPTGSQSSVLRRVRSKIISAGSAVALSEQEALTELLRCRDWYALQPHHLADCDIEGEVLPKDAVDLVSPSLAEVLRHPCSSMTRSSAELLHLEESEGPDTPYWDPTLRRDARQRVELFHKLADLKFFCFRKQARAFAGLFFVKKKDGMIRLIVDALQPNARPPTSTTHITQELALPTPWIGHISEVFLCGAGSDVRDGFYQFSNHRLADYFALQFKVRAGDYGVTKSLRPRDQRAHSCRARRSGVAGCRGRAGGLVLGCPTDVRVTGTGWDLAREKKVVPLMTPAEPFCSVYVDNINVHGITSESCDRRHEVIIAALEARGFSLHEVSRASQHHKQLGVHFDGVARILRRDPRRLWRVHLALCCLQRMGGHDPESCVF